MAHSIPPAYYTSQELTTAEITKVFRSGWVGVGRADLVKEPGDFITLDFAGQNLILLRDESGHLQAHANSCRHRATRLVDGSGSCKRLRCPFHCWSYALDGKLIAAPRMQRATGFEKSDYGLVSYRAEERLGFAFVCLSEEATDIDSYHSYLTISIAIAGQKIAFAVDHSFSDKLLTAIWHRKTYHYIGIDKLILSCIPYTIVTAIYSELPTPDTLLQHKLKHHSISVAPNG